MDDKHPDASNESETPEWSSKFDDTTSRGARKVKSYEQVCSTCGKTEELQIASEVIDVTATADDVSAGIATIEGETVQKPRLPKNFVDKLALFRKEAQVAEDATENRSHFYLVTDADKMRWEVHVPKNVEAYADNSYVLLLCLFAEIEGFKVINDGKEVTGHAIHTTVDSDSTFCTTFAETFYATSSIGGQVAIKGATPAKIQAINSAQVRIIQSLKGDLELPDEFLNSYDPKYWKVTSRVISSGNKKKGQKDQRESVPPILVKWLQNICPDETVQEEFKKTFLSFTRYALDSAKGRNVRRLKLASLAPSWKQVFSRLSRHHATTKSEEKKWKEGPMGKAGKPVPSTMVTAIEFPRTHPLVRPCEMDAVEFHYDYTQGDIKAMQQAYEAIDFSRVNAFKKYKDFLEDAEKKILAMYKQSEDFGKVVKKRKDKIPGEDTREKYAWMRKIRADKQAFDKVYYPEGHPLYLGNVFPSTICWISYATDEKTRELVEFKHSHLFSRLVAKPDLLESYPDQGTLYSLLIRYREEEIQEKTQDILLEDPIPKPLPKEKIRPGQCIVFDLEGKRFDGQYQEQEVVATGKYRELPTHHWFVAGGYRGDVSALDPACTNGKTWTRKK